ncbi:hypothetical protein [Vulgatibacter incomptus]|uniref:Response regulator receiver domain protein n=1 Tax=Vulgatibacter incomptus TaxID=1391653 RepID=A0A0K1PFU0_9BACT|nr:hypothetical protein [Vulgatibacter incomptus]AKU92403.1 Response regulator receiver domain protein [Vulgatibacter incomptus]
MRVLVCTHSEILSAIAVHALFASGHQVFAEGRPEPLACEAASASALLVSPALALEATALLRESGFRGRILLFDDLDEAGLEAKVAELGADGAIATSPLDSFGARFVARAARPSV